jgi:hypothetical protein
MQTNWQIGPVKLANGEDAFIDAINDKQEDYRYTGRVRNHAGQWISCGWHASRRYMHADTDHGWDLAPPPKKRVRVQAWLMVWPNGGVTVFHDENQPIADAKKHGFALFLIDREVTEGEGL